MKARFMIMALLTITGLTACDSASEGTDVTGTFLTSYSGQFQEPDFKETFDIQPDGSVTKTFVRQVGRDGDAEVPYPTSCSYVEIGQLRMIERSNESRSSYMGYATHMMVISLRKLELTNSHENTVSNPACVKFAERENAWISRGNARDQIYMELLSADSFRIHTAGGPEDEIYARVQ